MLFKNVDSKVIEECAEMINAHIYRQSSDPRRGVLRPNSNCIYRRVSASYCSGRKVNAVCWHGHRDFFRLLFQRAPEAIVETKAPIMGATFVRYTADNFEGTFKSTDVNIGPMIAPMLASDACSCPEGAF